jgi:hypothetical protein
MLLQISLTYTRNSSEPKTLPCGTPEVTRTSLDSRPPTLTLCVRHTRNSLTQTTTLESTPEAVSFLSSRSWGTKSKSLETYIIIASIATPSSKESAISCYTVMTIFTRLPRSKPMLSPYNHSFLSQTCLKCPDLPRIHEVQNLQPIRNYYTIYMCNQNSIFHQ